MDTTSKSYRSLYRHKNIHAGSSITLHKYIVESVIGRELPNGAEIHHVDGDGLNNAHSNLVVCPDRAYHALLHRRAKAIDACGNANWLPCMYCKKYCDPSQMTLYTPKDQRTPKAQHRECNRDYKRKKYGKNGCPVLS